MYKTSYLIVMQSNGNGVLTLDGTFGCVRNSSAGASIEEPQHGIHYFVRQELVDAFGDNYNDDCRNFLW